MNIERRVDRWSSVRKSWLLFIDDYCLMLCAVFSIAYAHTQFFRHLRPPHHRLLPSASSADWGVEGRTGDMCRPLGPGATLMPSSPRPPFLEHRASCRSLVFSQEKYIYIYPSSGDCSVERESGCVPAGCLLVYQSISQSLCCHLV